MLQKIAKNKIALSILIVVIIILSIGLRIAIWNKVSGNTGDLLIHFHDMRTHYDNGTIPTMGAGFLGIGNFNNTTTPRVPGSAFYLYYMICYAIGGGNLDNAIVVNCIFSILAVLVFLFWIYKRFGIIVCAILSSLVLSNGYYLYTNFIFYNPNIPLMVSFLFLPVLAEYISKERSFTASILIFPLLALMAQGHFATFHGLIPTVLVYMIIRYKHTIKNIVGLSIGVFLAFLTYLPYLISEVYSNFNNLKNVTSVASESRQIFNNIPRLQALMIFPTGEMSDHYDLEFFDFWKFDSTIEIVAFILFAIIFITIIFITIFSIVKFFRNKEFIYNTYMKQDNNAFMLKELLFIYLLYLPVCTLATSFLYGASGPFRYHTAIFTLSFIPLITFLYFIVKRNNQKLIFISLTFSIITMFYMSILQYTYYKKFDEPQNWKSYRDAVTSIAADADGNTFTIVGANLDMLGISYNNNGMWNRSENSSIIYNVSEKGQNKLDNNVYTNATLIVSNNIFIIHRID